MKGIAVLLVLAACNGEIAAMSDAPHGGGGSDSGSGTADVPGGIGEPANLMGITLYHNQVRAAVDTTGIAAGPLPPMKWDPNLAMYAAQWAAMCKDTAAPIGLVDHDPNRTNVAGYAYIGENIFGASGGATAKGAVDLWASEKASFTYPNTCNAPAGQSCGHYTQVVWRTSVNLGCALQECSALQYGSTIVCDYGPGGNDGGAPY